MREESKMREEDGSASISPEEEETVVRIFTKNTAVHSIFVERRFDMWIQKREQRETWTHGKEIAMREKW